MRLVWDDAIEEAAARLPALRKSALPGWKNLVSAAFSAYRSLAHASGRRTLAGGEGCHQAHQAINMMDHAALRYIQTTRGAWRHQLRPSGCPGARTRGSFVNHTFDASGPLGIVATLR